MVDHTRHPLDTAARSGLRQSSWPKLCLLGVAAGGARANLARAAEPKRRRARKLDSVDHLFDGDAVCGSRRGSSGNAVMIPIFTRKTRSRPGPPMPSLPLCRAPPLRERG